MSTAPAWNLTNPLKPVADFDKDAVRDIQFEWGPWLADLGTTYVDHSITAPVPLECLASSQAGGVITARIRVGTPGAAVLGGTYGVTCHIVAQDGQEDDRTLWLRIVRR